MLDSLYEKIQDFLLVMATGCCKEIDQEVTLSAEAVARILQLIMEKISRFAPSKYVTQGFTSRNQEINEALAIISGVREKLGINSDLKEMLDNEMGYTQLFQNINEADIQPLIAPDDVYAFFDAVMEFSFEIIKCIKECFEEDGILDDYAIEGELKSH